MGIAGACGSSSELSERRERTPPVCSHLLHRRPREEERRGEGPSWSVALTRGRARNRRGYGAKIPRGPSLPKYRHLPAQTDLFQAIIGPCPEMCSNGAPPEVGKFRSLGPSDSRLSAVSDEAPGPSNDGVVAVPKVHSNPAWSPPSQGEHAEPAPQPLCTLPYKSR